MDALESFLVRFTMLSGVRGDDDDFFVRYLAWFGSLSGVVYLPTIRRKNMNKSLRTQRPPGCVIFCLVVTVSFVLTTLVFPDISPIAKRPMPPP
jgi:hypothetical protein